MSASETAAFEAEMAKDPAIRDAVETQNLLITAVNRKALMAHVVAATPPTMAPPRDGSILSKFKWPIILSSVVVGALITLFAFKGNEEDVRESHENLHANITNNINPTKNEGLRASLEADNQVPSESNFIHTPSKTRAVQSTRRQFGGLETWVAPEVQQIEVDPTQNKLIECKDGTVIFVPENAFVDENGDVVTETVTLEIIEALTMDKIVAYNLATMNGAKALKSGGMIYVQPKLNGTDLNLAEGKSLHIEIPTSEYDSNMQAWQGVPDGNGNLNWENPQEIENYLVPVAMSTLDFLPFGFREEVAATLPFKNYRTSSKALEDSLYFALGIEKEFEEVAERVDSPVQKDSNNGNKNGLKVLNLSLGSHRTRNRDRARDFKMKRGLGGIIFQNLPKNKEISATFYKGKQSYVTSIDTTLLQTDLVGTVSIRFATEGCDPFSMGNVLVEENKIVYVDCSAWKCDMADESFASSESCEKCYIEPSSVFAIHQPEFEETFLATKEFQERLQALHKIKNAQPLFDLYLNNLEKNLHEIDQQVAAKLSGPNKAIFEAFAAEKLTNVRPNGQEYDELKKFYTSQSKKQQEKVRKAQQEYARKSAAELEAIQNEMAQLRMNFLQNQQDVYAKYATNSTNRSRGVSPPRTASLSSVNYFQPSPRVQNTNPQVGQQAAYKVNWYGTGWMNIDSYLHELSKGKKEVPIHVADAKGMKIYQSINSLNTLLSLNSTEDGFNAYFPTSQSEMFEKSLALGVTRADGQLKVAAQFFNPYTTSAITLNEWETVTEDEFKRRLKVLYPGGRRMLKALKDEEKRAREALERQKRAEEQRKKRQEELEKLQEQWDKEQAELQAKTEAIRKRQAAERSYVQHLENFINPCHEDFGKAASDEEVVAYPDKEAQFPGGTVEFMRWITDNIQYPKEAMEKGIQGKIYVQFVVERDGSASNVKIMNSDPKMKLLEAEAVRLVQGMPPWKSGEMDGRKVRSHLRIPIIFTLD